MLNKNRSLSLDLTKSKKKFKVDRKIILIVIVSVLVTFIISLATFTLRNNWGILSSIDAENYQNLKLNLKNLVDIKDDGQPTVIEVSNAVNLKLQNSILYTQIENNDLMLVYKDKVIIYRPSTNKLVNIFPVNN